MPNYPLYSIPAPEEAEVWEVDGIHWYIIYRDPIHNIPLAYHIEDPETLTTIFGPDQTPTPDRRVTRDQFFKAGAVPSGETRELVNLTDHPFDVLESQYENAARVNPALQDPEVFALVMSATLEGRAPTQAELQNTSWWRSHNEAERAWLFLHASDPETAQNFLTDQRRITSDWLRANGTNNIPRWLSNEIADLFSTGKISEGELQQTLTAITDPYARKIPQNVSKYLQTRLNEVNEKADNAAIKSGPSSIRNRIIDIYETAGFEPPGPETLERMVTRLSAGETGFNGIRSRVIGRAGSITSFLSIDSTSEHENTVRDLTRQWLGPRYGAWEDNQIRRWAGKLRNDPDARQELEATLSRQLRSLYPHIDDPSVTWDDLAQPWLEFASQAWGQTIDPEDKVVDELIRINDATEAEQMLLDRGLERGVPTVVENFQSSFARAFGGSGVVPPRL